MSPIQIKNEEMTDEEIQWHKERFKQYEKWIKSKLLTESRAKEDLEEIQAKFIEVFKDLYKTSKYFKNAIDNLTPAMDPSDAHLDEEFQQGGMKITHLHNNIIEWNRQKSFSKRGSAKFLKTFALLVNLCKKLNSEYETQITMITVENTFNPERPPIFFTVSRSEPIFSLYEVRGKTIKHREEVYFEKKPTRIMKTFNRFPDHILIHDFNFFSSKSGNVLTDGIAGLSRFTPTFVRYSNWDGNKKFLVSIPENLDVTTFLRDYGKILSKSHREFYQKRFRRPKSKDKKADIILHILEEKFGSWRRPHSINELAKEASRSLQERKVKGSSYENIRRNYIETFRQFRDAKNSR
jgi:hypothetical protein